MAGFFTLTPTFLFLGIVLISLWNIKKNYTLRGVNGILIVASVTILSLMAGNLLSAYGLVQSLFYGGISYRLTNFFYLILIITPLLPLYCLCRKYDHAFEVMCGVALLLILLESISFFEPLFSINFIQIHCFNAESILSFIGQKIGANLDTLFPYEFCTQGGIKISSSVLLIISVLLIAMTRREHLHWKIIGALSLLQITIILLHIFYAYLIIGLTDGSLKHLYFGVAYILLNILIALLLSGALYSSYVSSKTKRVHWYWAGSLILLSFDNFVLWFLMYLPVPY